MHNHRLYMSEYNSHIDRLIEPDSEGFKYSFNKVKVEFCDLSVIEIQRLL